MEAVCCRELRFAYPGGPEILRGLSFSLAEGETMAIAGLSGCGKTTLAQILSGLIPSAIPGQLSGEVLLFGRPLAGRNPAELIDEAALVFQDSDEQLLNTTVGDELAFGPENLGLPPARIRETVAAAARRYHLQDLLDQDPACLSGGQKKLVAIAATAVLSPRLLILDEPLSGLDARGRCLVTRLVAELREQGRTVLLIEHDLRSSLARLAQRWLLLADGRAAACGKPEELIHSGILARLELTDDDRD